MPSRFAKLTTAVGAYTAAAHKPQIADAGGKSAPDFTLKDQDGHDFTLSSLRGNPVLLIFYRGDW